MSKQLILVSAVVFLAALAQPATASAQISDDKLANAAIDVIHGYGSLTIFDDVTVTVADRAITLSGFVTMPFKREEVGARVAKIDGARSLANNIQVLPVSTTDGNLRARLAQAIYTHPAFWHYAAMACPPIHIIVANGQVVLTGIVNNETERALAFALAQVGGVRTVKNELRLDTR